MKTARITTGWIGDGLTPETAFRPAFLADHVVKKFTDKTGADPLQGGEFNIEVELEDAELTAVKANPKYIGKIIEIDKVGKIDEPK